MTLSTAARLLVRAFALACALFAALSSAAGAAGVGVVSPKKGELDVFLRHDGDGSGSDPDADSLVMMQRLEGVWQAPVNVGGSIHRDSEISATATGGGSFMIAVRWADDSIRVREWTVAGGWGSWLSRGTGNAGPAVSAYGDGKVALAWRNAYGNVQMRSRSGNTWELSGNLESQPLPANTAPAVIPAGDGLELNHFTSGTSLAVRGLWDGTGYAAVDDYWTDAELMYGTSPGVKRTISSGGDGRFIGGNASRHVVQLLAAPSDEVGSTLDMGGTVAGSVATSRPGESTIPNTPGSVRAYETASSSARRYELFWREDNGCVATRFSATLTPETSWSPETEPRAPTGGRCSWPTRLDGTVSIAPDVSSKTAPAKFELTATTTGSIAASSVVWDLDADGDYDDGSGATATVVRNADQIGTAVIRARSSAAPAATAVTSLTAKPWRGAGIADMAHDVVDVSARSDRSIMVNAVTGDATITLASLVNAKLAGTPLALTYHSLRESVGEFGIGTSLSWGRDITAAKTASPLDSVAIVRGPAYDEALMPADGTTFTGPKRWQWTGAGGNQSAATALSGGLLTPTTGGADLTIGEATVHFPSLPTVSSADDTGARATSVESLDGDTLTFDYDTASGGTIGVDRSDADDEDEIVKIVASDGKITSIADTSSGYEATYDSTGRLTRLHPLDSLAGDTGDTVLTWSDDVLAEVSNSVSSAALTYDSSRRVLSVESTAGTSSVSHTFAYSSSTTTHATGSDATTYHLSADPATHPSSEVASSDSEDDSAPLVVARGDNATSGDGGAMVVWVPQAATPVQVSLTVEDDASGIESVTAGGRSLVVGANCTGSAAVCTRSATVTFQASPGSTSLSDAWPNWHSVPGGTSSALISCQPVIATDREGNDSSTTVCIAVDAGAPDPPSELVQDGLASGDASIRWMTGVDADETAMPGAFADLGVVAKPAGSGVIGEQFRYKRPNDSAFSAWSSPLSGEGSIPGISAGDVVNVQLRSVDAVGNLSDIDDTTLVVVAESEADPELGEQDPAEFDGTGTRSLHIQVVDRTFVAPHESAPPSVPFAWVRIKDGDQILRAQADDDGQLTITKINSATVGFALVGQSEFTSVATSSSSPPVTTVDVTGTRASIADDGAGAIGWGGLLDTMKRNHPSLYKWCVPSDLTVAAALLAGPATVAAFQARRAKTCRTVQNNVDRAQQFGAVTYFPAKPGNPVVGYDRTKANAIQHAAWGMFLAFDIYNQSSLVVHRKGALRVIDYYYEKDQLELFDVPASNTRAQNLNLQRGSRMDTWNDDRGWDLAKNRKGSGGFDLKEQSRICRALIGRALTSVKAHYFPNTYYFIPGHRPPGNQLIYNQVRADPEHGKNFEVYPMPPWLVWSACDPMLRRQLLTELEDSTQTAGWIPGWCPPDKGDYWLPDVGCVWYW